MSAPANFGNARPIIDPDNAAMLLIDHQSGLFQTIHDMPFSAVRAHAVALARMATLAGMPVITTASVPQGPNGPLIPEIHQLNPDAVYIPRTGQINAWDNPKWVEAIEKTKRKTLLIAGTLTSVCMAFPTLSAVVAGYKVFCIVDASGNWSKMATDLTIARIAQAGAMPIDAITMAPFQVLLAPVMSVSPARKAVCPARRSRSSRGRHGNGCKAVCSFTHCESPLFPGPPKAPWKAGNRKTANR